MSNQKPSQKRPLKNVGPLLGIGAEMGVVIFLSNYLGKWLDIEFQTSNIEAISTLSGVFIAMFLVVYRVNRFNK